MMNDTDKLDDTNEQAREETQKLKSKLKHIIYIEGVVANNHIK